MAKSKQANPKQGSPLVEAIFELRWNLPQAVPNTPPIDPNYKLLVGRLYDKLLPEYSFHEPQPASAMPEEIAAGIIQHRFRKAENDGPLVQIGPGIFTVNDTTKYEWNDFKKRTLNAVRSLYESYSTSKAVDVNSLVLRYVNVVEFDFSEDIIEYLRNELNLDVKLSESVINNENLVSTPTAIDFKFAFKCNNPKGIVQLNFSNGKKKDKDGLVWNLIFISNKENLPNMTDGLEEWLENTNKILNDLFTSLKK